MHRDPDMRLASICKRLRDGGWEPGEAAGWSEEETYRNYLVLEDCCTQDKTLLLACVSVELLAEHEPDTVRGNMYLVVSKGWLPDTSDKSYDRVQRLLVRLREAGAVPFSWIVDNIRSTIKPSSWSGLADFVETVSHAYRLDFWARLPEYIEVIAEKDTIAGKLSVVTRKYDVPLHPIRGYNSTTFCHQIARGWDEITKPITVYYIGDHDPSGRDLERDVRERLQRYSKHPFKWQRLGFNPEHFEAFAVTPLNVKKTDKRWKKFVEQWGESCAEIEAIPATALREILREAIESHIPMDQWTFLEAQQDRERQHMQGLITLLGRKSAEEDLPPEEPTE